MDDLGLNSLGTYLNPVLEYLQLGFDRVNAAQGLAIALVAAILTRKWLQLPMVAILATIGHAVIDTAVPIVAGQSALKLPPLVDPVYWQYLAALFAGYLVIVALFYAAKRGIMGLIKRAVPASASASPSPSPVAAAGAAPSTASTGPGVRPSAPPPPKHK